MDDNAITAQRLRELADEMEDGKQAALSCVYITSDGEHGMVIGGTHLTTDEQEQIQESAEEFLANMAPDSQDDDADDKPFTH